MARLSNCVHSGDAHYGQQQSAFGGWAFYALALLWCAVMIGCGPGGPPLLGVSGQVTYDGQPVSNGSIGFSPTDPSAGKGGAADLIEGRYEFPDGLPAGNYTVWIEAQRPSGKKFPSEDGGAPVDQLVQYIPAAYNTDSTLQVEITTDRDDLDFLLEKVAPRRR